MSNSHPSLTLPKTETAVTQETEAIAKEFMAPFQKIAESRLKLKETQEELLGMFTQLTAKMDTLTELKKENLDLEKDVLQKIKVKLG